MTRDNDTTLDDLISAREAAKLLKVSLDSLHRWRLAGKIRAWRLGGRWRFHRADVEGLAMPWRVPQFPPPANRQRSPGITPEEMAELKRRRLI